jgi:hypothetical protein
MERDAWRTTWDQMSKIRICCEHPAASVTLASHSPGWLPKARRNDMRWWASAKAVVGIVPILNPMSPPPDLAHQYKRNEEIKQEQREAGLRTGLDSENSRLYTIDEVESGTAPRQQPTEGLAPVQPSRQAVARVPTPEATPAKEQSGRLVPKRVPIASRRSPTPSRIRGR